VGYRWGVREHLAYKVAKLDREEKELFPVSSGGAAAVRNWQIDIRDLAGNGLRSRPYR
jgi:hypothetical protein